MGWHLELALRPFLSVLPGRRGQAAAPVQPVQQESVGFSQSIVLCWAHCQTMWLHTVQTSISPRARVILLHLVSHWPPSRVSHRRVVGFAVRSLEKMPQIDWWLFLLFVHFIKKKNQFCQMTRFPFKFIHVFKEAALRSVHILLSLKGSLQDTDPWSLIPFYWPRVTDPRLLTWDPSAAITC